MQVAVSSEQFRWRWQIWLDGRLVEESGERYLTMADALADGHRRAGALRPEEDDGTSRRRRRERRPE